MIPLEVLGLLVVAVCDRKSVASPWWRCHNNNNNNGTVAVGRGFKFKPPQI